jgi:hypothetical protein
MISLVLFKELKALCHKMDIFVEGYKIRMHV